MKHLHSKNVCALICRYCNIGNFINLSWLVRIGQNNKLYCSCPHVLCEGFLIYLYIFQTFRQFPLKHLPLSEVLSLDDVLSLQLTLHFHLCSYCYQTCYCVTVCADHSTLHTKVMRLILNKHWTRSKTTSKVILLKSYIYFVNVYFFPNDLATPPPKEKQTNKKVE